MADKPDFKALAARFKEIHDRAFGADDVPDDVSLEIDEPKFVGAEDSGVQMSIGQPADVQVPRSAMGPLDALAYDTKEGLNKIKKNVTGPAGEWIDKNIGDPLVEFERWKAENLTRAPHDPEDMMGLKEGGWQDKVGARKKLLSKEDIAFTKTPEYATNVKDIYTNIALLAPGAGGIGAAAKAADAAEAAIAGSRLLQSTPTLRAILSVAGRTAAATSAGVAESTALNTGINLLKPSAKIDDNAGAAALLGAVPGAIEVARGAAKPLGKLNQMLWSSVSNEIERLAATPSIEQLARNSAAPKGVGFYLKQADSAAGNFVPEAVIKPSAVVIVRTPEGKFQGVLTELHTNQEPKFSVVPLESDADFAKLGKRARRDNVALSMSDSAKASVGELSPDHFKSLFSVDEHLMAAEPRAMDAADAALHKGYVAEARASADTIPYATPGVKTVRGRRMSNGAEPTDVFGSEDALPIAKTEPGIPSKRDFEKTNPLAKADPGPDLDAPVRGADSVADMEVLPDGRLVARPSGPTSEDYRQRMLKANELENQYQVQSTPQQWVARKRAGQAADVARAKYLDSLGRPTDPTMAAAPIDEVARDLKEPSTIPYQGLDAMKRGQMDFGAAIKTYQQPATKVANLKDAAKIGLSRQESVMRGLVPFGGGSGGKPPPIADIKDIVPPSVPEPPSYAQPLEGEARTIQQVRGVMGLLEKQAQGDQKKMRKLWNTFLGGFADEIYLTPREIQGYMWQLYGAKSLEREEPIIRKALAANLPNKSVLGKAQNALYDVATGRMSMDAFAKAHPEVAAHQRQFINKYLTEVQYNHEFLVNKGWVVGKPSWMKGDGALEQYAANVYAAHFLPKGAQLKRVQTNSELYEKCAAELAKDHPTWTAAQVKKELDGILNAKDPTYAAWKVKLGSDDDAQNALRARKKLSPAFQDALGKLNNGPIVIAASLAKQRSLVAQAQAWDSIMSSPLFSKVETAEHTVQILLNHAAFGPAAGGWLKPEAEIFTRLPQVSEQASSIARAFGAFSSKWKGFVTVYGGARPWANNISRNFEGSMYAGGIDITKPVDAMRKLKQAYSLLSEWERDPSPVGKAALVHEARKAGAVSAGFLQVEGDNADRTLFKALEKELNGSSDMHSALGNIFENVVEKMKLLPDKARKMYDRIDQTFKLANYIGLREQNLAKGMTLEQAARDAAVKINMSFPNPEYPGKLAKAVKPYSGLFNPFSTMSLEDMRVRGMSAHRMATEPGFANRVAMTAFVLSAAGQAVDTWRRSNGISDDEVQAELAARSKSSDFYKPAAYPLPTRDSKGHVQFLDLSAGLFPLLQLMQGSPEDSAGKKIAYNLSAGLLAIQGGALENPVRGILEDSGALEPTPNFSRDPRYAERNPLDYAKKLASPYSPVIPGAIQSFRQDLRRVEPPNPNKEPSLTWGQLAARQLSGVPIVPRNVEGQTETSIEMKRLAKEAQKIAADGSLSQAERDRQLKTTADRIDELSRQQAAKDAIIQKYQRSKK